MDENISSLQLGDIYKSYPLDSLTKSFSSAFAAFNSAIPASLYDSVPIVSIGKTISSMSSQMNLTSIYNQINFSVTNPMAQALSTIKKINLDNYLVFQNTTNILNNFNTGMKYYNEYLKVDNLYNETTDEKLNDFSIDKPRFKHWKHKLPELQIVWSFVRKFLLKILKHYTVDLGWDRIDILFVLPMLFKFLNWLVALFFPN